MSDSNPKVEIAKLSWPYWSVRYFERSDMVTWKHFRWVWGHKRAVALGKKWLAEGGPTPPEPDVVERITLDEEV